MSDPEASPTDEDAAPMFEGMTSEKLRAVASWLDTYDAIVERVVFAIGGEDVLDGERLVAIRGKEVQDDLRRWADDIDRWTASTNEGAS